MRRQAIPDGDAERRVRIVEAGGLLRRREESEGLDVAVEQLVEAARRILRSFADVPTDVEPALGSYSVVRQRTL
jgi:hypothetical protein